jgi:hypothetical protein
MGDPNAAPVPEPPGDDADRADHGTDDAAWTNEWAERQWNDIVAELTTPVPGGPSEPPDRPSEPLPDTDDPSAAPAAPVRATGPRDWPTTPEVEALEDADSHYEPPDPGHVLGRDPLANLAWVLVTVAPLVMLVTLLVARPFPRLLGEIAGAAFLAGVGILVWRMPRDRDDDGPGAVV